MIYYTYPTENKEYFNTTDAYLLQTINNAVYTVLKEKIKLRSYATSAAIGALICMAFVIVEGRVFDRSTTHIWIIYSGMMFSKYLIDAITLKKKEDVLCSILWGLICILHIWYYMIENVGG